jgi:hypothetical protein
MADNARGLSPRQEQWFASVVEGLAKETGKSLEEWAEIVRRECPAGLHRQRLAWLKQTHGLGVNRGSVILDAAFGSLQWDQPDALAEALWPAPNQRAIVAVVQALVADWPGVSVNQRKSFTAFSRSVQFAALAPIKGGGARLGLAILADEAPLLELPRKREAWSERLRSVLVLESAASIDQHAERLVKAAYDVS